MPSPVVLSPLSPLVRAQTDRRGSISEGKEEAVWNSGGEASEDRCDPAGKENAVDPAVS